MNDQIVNAKQLISWVIKIIQSLSMLQEENSLLADRCVKVTSNPGVVPQELRLHPIFWHLLRARGVAMTTPLVGSPILP